MESVNKYDELLAVVPVNCSISVDRDMTSENILQTVKNIGSREIEKADN